MKTINILLSILIMSSTSFAREVATSDIKNSVDACTSAKTSILDMRSCVRQGQTIAYHILGITLLELKDKHSHEKVIIRRLMASQAFWDSYMKAECSYQATEMLGRTSEDLIFESCQLDLTLKRIDVLKSSGK